MPAAIESRTNLEATVAEALAALGNRVDRSIRFGGRRLDDLDHPALDIVDGLLHDQGGDAAVEPGPGPIVRLHAQLRQEGASSARLYDLEEVVRFLEECWGHRPRSIADLGDQMRESLEAASANILRNPFDPKYVPLPATIETLADASRLIHEASRSPRPPAGPCSEGRIEFDSGALSDRDPPADDEAEHLDNPPRPRPCVVRAGRSLEWVVKEYPDLTPAQGMKPYSHEQYEAIREHWTDYPERGGKSGAPKYDAWARYIREYLKAVDGPQQTHRAGRTGRSIVPSCAM